MMSSTIKCLAIYVIGMYMLNAGADEVVPNKHERYAAGRAIGVVLQIAVAPEISEGKGRFGGTGLAVVDDKILVRASIHNQGDNEAYLLSLAEDAIRHPCKHLYLSDANDRLMSLVDKNPNFPQPSSLEDEILVAKVMLDCPSGLLKWQKEEIEKMRPRWDRFRNSLHVSVRVVNDSIHRPSRAATTRNSIECKFKEALNK